MGIGIVFCQQTKKSDEKTDDDKFKELIRKMENRKIYKKIDEKILAQIPDNDLELAIIDYIHTKFTKDWSNELEVVSKLSMGMKSLYATWTLEAEVNNGGFNQFFYNQPYDFARMAEAGFKLFKADKHFQLMKKANVIYEEEKKKLKQFKDKGTIEAFSESYDHTQLNKLDERFYNLKEDLSKLRIKYIRTHSKEFIGN